MAGCDTADLLLLQEPPQNSQVANAKLKALHLECLWAPTHPPNISSSPTSRGLQSLAMGIACCLPFASLISASDCTFIQCHYFINV